MSKQQQDVGDRAVAVQAGGSVSVIQGIPVDQVIAIVRAARGDIDNHFVRDAMEEMARRVERLEDKIIQRLEAGEGKPERLADPDVQILLVDAKKSFARSGDETLADTLAKIIIERSMCQERDRLALILNRAVEVTPSLTPQDLAVLSATFLLGNTRNHGVQNRVTFEGYLGSHILPFLSEMRDADGSLQYLQATGCLSFNQFASATLETIFLSNYGEIFARGFARDVFDSRVRPLAKGPDVAQFLTTVSENSKLLRFSTVSLIELRQQLNAMQIPDATIAAAVALGEEHQLKGVDLERDIAASVAWAPELFAAWSKASFAQVRLTATGIAIAHANAQRVVPGFTGDLGIWIT